MRSLTWRICVSMVSLQAVYARQFDSRQSGSKHLRFDGLIRLTNDLYQCAKRCACTKRSGTPSASCMTRVWAQKSGVSLIEYSIRTLRMVGVRGLEPRASWSRTKRDTKLRHTPPHSVKRRNPWYTALSPCIHALIVTNVICQKHLSKSPF